MTMTDIVERRTRVLVAKPGLDIHDRGALLLCKAFRDVGMEVIYTGLWQTAEMIAAAAIEEDADAIAISLLDGQPVLIFNEIMEELRKRGGGDICVIGGGTAIIDTDEIKLQLENIGVTGLYGPGTSLGVIVNHVVEMVKRKRKLTAL